MQWKWKIHLLKGNLQQKLLNFAKNALYTCIGCEKMFLQIKLQQILGFSQEEVTRYEDLLYVLQNHLPLCHTTCIFSFPTVSRTVEMSSAFTCEC